MQGKNTLRPLLTLGALLGVMASALAATPSPSDLIGNKEAQQATAQAMPTVAQPATMDPRTNARLVDIAKSLRCLPCANESIAESQTEAAIALRDETQKLIREGRTDEEIIDYMVERYGDVVLYKPQFKGATMLLWVAPGLFIVLAVAILVMGARRRRANRESGGEDRSQTEHERERLALSMLRGECPFDAARLLGTTLQPQKGE